MNRLSKLAAAKQLLAAYLPLYQCPLCKTSFHTNDAGSFVCERGHQFDVSKPGYLYLLAHGNKTKYDKVLFEARHHIAEAGFFQGLTQRLTELLETLPHGVVLDAGSGEGSQLAAIKQLTGEEYTYIGVDIAKEGIKQAARDFSDILWAVADLANSPFASRSVDVILNILSPSNYEEFARILKPGGYLLKVVPETDYLQELRQFDPRLQESYSNQEVLDRFRASFEWIGSERLTYTAELPPERVPDLLTMTPLGWHLKAEDKEALLTQTTYTVDYRILVGKAK
ncbi:Ribosomal RNA large subunit methyltransferase A [Listeria grayi]|uniref:Ribosomal RNA large subunit methyltransferase A n=1 Tax=Listeria grayi TaxID=1641 RepID=A0A378M8W8_LISGR|nr:methyltransferase domain-containing protein [Listeria grayi]STY42807.1 Ribosomal RNA large subunit methyltransferase A [Listeria grayi]